MLHCIAACCRVFSIVKFRSQKKELSHVKNVTWCYGCDSHDCYECDVTLWVWRDVISMTWLPWLLRVWRDIMSVTWLTCQWLLWVWRDVISKTWRYERDVTRVIVMSVTWRFEFDVKLWVWRDSRVVSDVTLWVWHDIMSESWRYESDSVLSKTDIFPKKEGRKRENSNESARGSWPRQADV